MKSLMVRSAVGLGATLTVLLPAVASAATPQQIIDKGLNDMTFSMPTLASGDINVSMSERDANKRAAKSNGIITLLVSERKIPKAGQAIPDMDGTIAVKRVEGTGSFAVPTVVDPGTIEFRITNNVGYVRVKTVSDAVRMFLAAKGVDTNAAVGTWVKIDPQEICAALGNSCSAVQSAATKGISQSTDLLTQKPIQVIGTEKRWTAKNGDKMVRVRARVNPSIVTAFQKKAIAAVGKKDPKRAAKLADIQKQVVEMRKQIASVKMAINVNLTKSTIDRVEALVSQVVPKQTCTTNAKTKKQICKTTSFQTTTIHTGMNVTKGSTTPVVAPETSVSAVTVATQAMKFIPGIK